MRWDDAPRGVAEADLMQGSFIALFEKLHRANRGGESAGQYGFSACQASRRPEEG